MNKLTALFPEHVVVYQLCKRKRSLLLIDNTFMVSFLFCGIERRNGVPPYWIVEPFPAECGNITLLCTLNHRHDGVLDHYIFPKMDMWKSHRLRRNDPVPGCVVRLNRLEDFYATVKNFWRARVQAANSGT